jgi:hypothetical protein
VSDVTANESTALTLKENMVLLRSVVSMLGLGECCFCLQRCVALLVGLLLLNRYGTILHHADGSLHEEPRRSVSDNMSEILDNTK